MQKEEQLIIDVRCQTNPNTKETNTRSTDLQAMCATRLELVPKVLEAGDVGRAVKD